MRICFPMETHPGEKKVIVTPSLVVRLVEAGWDVVIESGAGAGAGHDDRAYAAAGATVTQHQEEIWETADVVAKVRVPGVHPNGTCECDSLREGALLISFLYPDQNPVVLASLGKRQASAFAIDRIPRISRAQKVDALSAMANIAGYRAVVEASVRFGRFFTGQMTAAGKVPPAQVLVIGAGVAGLAAIAASKAMGAVVRAFDVRPAVEDQVRSLGAEFLTVKVAESGDGQGGYAREMSKAFIDAEMELFREQAKKVDIVITTALIPGKPAPKLWLKDMVSLMRPGSVIVDLAAENGGNCEMTLPDEVVVHQGITIIGYTDLASRMAGVASDMLGGILFHLLDEFGGPEKFSIDLDNDIVRGGLVLLKGEKIPTQAKIESPAPKLAHPLKPNVNPIKVQLEPSIPLSLSGMLIAGIGLLAAGSWFYLRYSAGSENLVSEAARNFLQHLTVFVMAIFVGWQVILKVKSALHTPLMAVTNATSGIIVIGGILGSKGKLDISVVTALIATLFATINIVGGFLVTHRMLAMFRK